MEKFRFELANCETGNTSAYIIAAKDLEDATYRAKLMLQRVLTHNRREKLEVVNVTPWPTKSERHDISDMLMPAGRGNW